MTGRFMKERVTYRTQSRWSILFSLHPEAWHAIVIDPRGKQSQWRLAGKPSEAMCDSLRSLHMAKLEELGGAISQMELFEA